MRVGKFIMFQSPAKPLSRHCPFSCIFNRNDTLSPFLIFEPERLTFSLNAAIRPPDHLPRSQPGETQEKDFPPLALLAVNVSKDKLFTVLF
jgi:hypothetical protein